jgi:hypothetical protein
MVGQTLDMEERVFRVEVLEAIFASNVSVGGSRPILALLERNTKGLKLGDPKNLNPFIPIVLASEVQKILDILDSSYAQYGCTIDGSPFFAEFEAVTIRVVTKKMDIVELVLRVAALTKTPNAPTLAANTQEAIVGRGRRKLKDWRTIMADRAATNGAAARLCREAKDGELFEAKCGAHTVVKVGDKFVYPELKRIMHKYTMMIMHPGGARILAASNFDETVKLGGGVRWWVKHEQSDQVQKFGLENLRRDVVDVCVKEKWSEESAKGLQVLLDDVPVLSKALVQLAAITDGGRVFCAVTYLLESNGPMIFVAYDLLKR